MSFNAGNCTNPPPSAATDAGVAGTGVLLSFIITAGLSLILSAVIILFEMRRSSEAKISRKLLLSFSDQQLVTGIGIQCVGLAKMDTMVPYHFFIIWMLSLLSTATHLASLLSLVGNFKRDWVLRWVRQGLMFVNLLLSSVFGIFVLVNVMNGLPQTLPIGCVWEVESKGAAGNAALSVTGTIAVLAGNLIVFGLSTWYLHSRSGWIKTVQVVGLLFLLAIGIGATVRVILLSQAFGNPSVDLNDNGEQVWSFGQLLPMLLLLLPLLSALEITRGEMKVAPPVVDESSQPLVGSAAELGEEMKPQRHTYQPNPFFGSDTNLFRK